MLNYPRRRHRRSVSIGILSGEGTFGKARLLQLIDLAFNSHPFLSAIVSRTVRTLTHPPGRDALLI